MIYLLPLCTSMVLTGFFLFSDESIVWKSAALLPLLASLAMQWIPSVHTHFIIPLLIQSTLSIVLIIYYKIQ